MFDCYVIKINVRRSDYHFADRDKLYEAPNQGFWQAIQRTYLYWTVGLLVFKFIKSKEKSNGCARKRTIMIFFYIVCKNLDASLLLASRAKKTPDICLL